MLAELDCQHDRTALMALKCIAPAAALAALGTTEVVTASLSFIG